MTGTSPGSTPEHEHSLVPGGLGYVPRRVDDTPAASTDASPARRHRGERAALWLGGTGTLVAAALLAWSVGPPPLALSPPPSAPSPGTTEGPTTRPTPRPTPARSTAVPGPAPADASWTPMVRAAEARPPAGATAAARTTAPAPARVSATTPASAVPTQPATTTTAQTGRQRVLPPGQTRAAPTSPGPTREPGTTHPEHPRPSQPPSSPRPSQKPSAPPTAGRAALAAVADAVAAVSNPGARNILTRAWDAASARITSGDAEGGLAAFEARLAQRPQLTDDESARIAAALTRVREAF